jgi:hypothetical protein
LCDDDLREGRLQNFADLAKLIFSEAFKTWAKRQSAGVTCSHLRAGFDELKVGGDLPLPICEVHLNELRVSHLDRDERKLIFEFHVQAQFIDALDPLCGREGPEVLPVVQEAIGELLICHGQSPNAAAPKKARPKPTMQRMSSMRFSVMPLFLHRS